MKGASHGRSVQGNSWMHWAGVLFQPLTDYGVDTCQRSLLFVDVLRQQGNQYFTHIHNGLKPVLTFTYERIMDGRSLDRPVNYSLVKIINRRKKRRLVTEPSDERRRHPLEDRPEDLSSRPIVIVDPRAGQGPGIGGSKQDSEIGVALDKGHPVYYIIFEAEPVEGQTLSDVKDAEIQFLEAVIRRHPKADKPAVIGNCQAGWAVAILCAERPDLAGAVVLNGAPLSYWAGRNGKNPMRYKGGLIGGIWMTSLWSDIGNGKFDGASLVAGFEDLNPGHTYCRKPYHLYANIDTEPRRYLAFEKWWNGFFYMTAAEIHFIVENLFLGNKLENGGIEFVPGQPVDLRHINCPVIVFASDGDNITPPPQALNWITRVWRSVDEIKREQQVIVYLLHESIGHLGIFVSGRIARTQHREIISTLDMVDYLSPGLYEMIIDTPQDNPVPGRNKVRFEARSFTDILNLDDGDDDELDFLPVAQLSDFNDTVYKIFVSPWVRLGTNPLTAEWIRMLHPMRIPRYLFSDINPFMLPVAIAAPAVRDARVSACPDTDDNLFKIMETAWVEASGSLLDAFRDMRDLCQEYCFKAMYSNPFMQLYSREMYNANYRHADARQLEQTEAFSAAEDQYWKEAVDEGGFAEGVVRIMVAMAISDGSFDKEEYRVSRRYVRHHDRLSAIHPSVFKQLVRRQSRILEYDADLAIKALPKLIKTRTDRETALAIARLIADADAVMTDAEAALLDRISRYLAVDDGCAGRTVS